MKTICAKAGLVGNFTNHSGKRTCATQLYNAGVAEQEIMKRTGHRSEKSVRKYKRSSDEISENVSNVLNPPSNKKIVKSENRDVALGMEIENENATDCKSEKNPNAADGRSARVTCTETVPFRDITDKTVFQNCQVAFNFN